MDRELDLVTQDRDAAVALLRLHVVGHSFDPNCKHNAGLACYSCRTVKWLRDFDERRNGPTPEQREAPACQACGSTRGMPESMRDNGCLNCHGDGPDPATQPTATKPRDPGCKCHREEGDSECPVHDAPTATKPCRDCGGSGKVVFRDGPWTDSAPCPTCHGEGKVPA